MDVGLYVSELLNELNEISLPGIGTFYKKNVSAYFDEKQGIFFPPAQTLAFTSGDPSVSPELITEICLSRNISEPSARYFTEKYCDTIRQSLQIKGYATIGTLGKLRVSGDDTIFEPATAEESSSVYGLSPVMEIKRTPFKNTAPDFSAIRSKTPEPALEKPESVEKSNKTGLLILLALLLIGGGIVGAYFYYPQLFDILKKPVDTTEQPVIQIAPMPQPLTMEDSLAKADSIMENNFEQLKEEGIEVEKSKDTVEISTKANPVTTDTVKLATSTKYEIICASFNRKSEAETSVKIFRKRGIDANIIIDTKKPIYKVSLGSFTNFEAANRERRRIQEEIAKDAWILILKNK